MWQQDETGQSEIPLWIPVNNIGQIKQTKQKIKLNLNAKTFPKNTVY